MNNLFTFIKQKSGIIILGIILAVLFYTNYTPGTFLTGWDNLHPEFNFQLNFQRAFHSVWQEYQGLGLLAGMAHASDLLRVLFLWAVSFVIPTEGIRYFYHFLMLTVGTFGMYAFLNSIIFTKNENQVKKSGAFLGSLFYLFNLGSIQYFFVPFEPYSTFWGFFPWELLTLFQFLKKPTKKNLFLLAVVNLAAAAQAYVQTIFFIYFICLLLIAIIYLITVHTKRALMNIFLVLTVVIAVNAFWILPQGYFVLKDVQVTQNAMQNRMATEKFFQMNKRRGTVDNFVLLKEFYYDFLDSNTTANPSGYLMEPWRIQFEQPYVMIIGSLFFLIALYGIFSPHPLRKYTIGLFILSSIAFLSDTPGVESMNSLLRAIPIVNQVFRNPFTKFIVPTVFTFASGFGIGTALLLSHLEKKKILNLFITGSIVILFGFMIYPAFQGNYISKTMRTSIPKEYFDLFEYFKSVDKNSRIMNLPQGGYWGWYYYDWGWHGSGFIWYGIEQPIMDRAFDVWSDELESYYWQLTDALRKNDQAEFNAILDKYQIDYIVYDENLLQSDPFNPVKLAYKQKDFVENDPKFTLVKKFKSIYIYKVSHPNKQRSSLSLYSGVQNILYNEPFSQKDTAYEQHTVYKTDFTKPFSIIYPFESLFSSRFPDERTISIKKNDTSFIISSPIPEGAYRFAPPAYSATESLLPVQISAKKDSNGDITFLLTGKLPTLLVDGKEIPLDTYRKEITLPASSDKTILISVNNTDNFTASNLSTSYKIVGNTSLFIKDLDNTIKFYSTTQSSKIQLNPESFQSPQICGIKKNDPKVNAQYSDTTNILEASNTSVCQVYKNTLSMKSPSLMEVTFEYQSSSDEFPRYCFYSQNVNGCLNKKDNISYGFSSKFTPFVDRFEINEDQKTISPQLILEAVRDEDLDHEKKISYRNIEVVSYPLLQKIDLTFQSVKNGVIPSGELELENLSNLQITYPYNNDSRSRTHIISSHQYKTGAFNYDTSLTGTYSLTQKKEQKQSLVELTSTQASSYFLTQWYDLPMKYSYLLDVTSKNNEGMPLFMNLFSAKDLRNYTYTMIPLSKKLTTYDYIIPPGNTFDTGFNILMNSISYTDKLSSNDIAEINLYQFPYHYVSQMKLTNGVVTSTAPLPIHLTAQKNHLYSYTITVPSTTQDASLFFAQAYDTGWIAYNGDSPVSFSQLLPHFKMNNWANGWQVDRSNKPQTIHIIFWPQYLEYAGLIILIGVISILSIRALPQKEKGRAHKG